MSKNKSIFSTPPRPESQITLSNPYTDEFEKFIIYNSMAWQTRALVEFEQTVPPATYQDLEDEFMLYRPGMAFGSSTKWHDAIDEFASSRYFVPKGCAKGQHLVLCGAGPSLAENIAEWAPKGDQIWGCNSAVTWLAKEGYKPTHGFTVDQTSHTYLEWKDAPQDIEYLCATTIHPSLTDFLITTGRRYRYFNNFVGLRALPVGWPDAKGVERVMSREEWLYALLFPQTIQLGSGLNSVTRALDLAAHMDFAKVTVLGADCCIRTHGKPNKKWQLGSKPHLKWLRKNTVMHADGGHALASEATPMVFQATIDGRFIMTKPDLAISTRWIIRMAKASGGKIQLIGDTLPNLLYDKDDAFWARMPRLTDGDGNDCTIPF